MTSLSQFVKENNIRVHLHRIERQVRLVEITDIPSSPRATIQISNKSYRVVPREESTRDVVHTND